MTDDELFRIGIEVYPEGVWLKCRAMMRIAIAAHTEKLLAGVEMPEPVSWCRQKDIASVKKLPAGYAGVMWREQMTFVENGGTADIAMFTHEQLQQYAAAAALKVRGEVLEEAKGVVDSVLGVNNISGAIEALKGKVPAVDWVNDTPPPVGTKLYTAPQPVVKTPPEWWPAVENILTEYGLDAISFVADFKKASGDYPARIKQDISAPQAQQDKLPVNWAAMIHYPECWDTAAYPELRDAIHETLAWSGCSVCKPAPQAQQPLTDDQIKAGRTEGYDAEDAPDAWDFEQGVKFAERHHGIGGEE